MSKSLRGMRIAILSEGTRGDCQPYLALALALQKEGSIVRIMSNANNKEFVTGQGLDFAPVFADGFKRFSDPRVMESMKSGDVFKFLGATGAIAKEDFPDELDRGWAALTAFNPDMVLYSLLASGLGEMYASAKGIPGIEAFLGIYLFTGEVGPAGFNTPFAFANRFLWKLVIKEFLGTQLEKMEVAKAKFGAIDFKGLPRTVGEYIEKMNEPLSPKLIGVSGVVCTVPKDVPCPNIEATGWWILDSTHQVERFKQGDPAFGGSEKESIEAFLQSGAPPVYIGWGSMIAVSSEFMTNLAVSTLKQTKQRGIVLKGWGGLDPALLDNDDLKAYAKDNVLFLKSAPHEWLLPQCALSIIHGGSGTTASALRSGKPTIVTPVFNDQFDFAKAVDRLKVGVATSRFGVVTTDILTVAVRKCLSDEEISRNAANLSQQLKSEDGLGRAIGSLKAFIEGPLANGTWYRMTEERDNRWKSARNSWFC